MLIPLTIIIDVDGFPNPLSTYLCGTGEDTYMYAFLATPAGSNYFLLEDESGVVEKEDDTDHIEQE